MSDFLKFLFIIMIISFSNQKRKFSLSKISQNKRKKFIITIIIIIIIIIIVIIIMMIIIKL